MGSGSYFAGNRTFIRLYYGISPGALLSSHHPFPEKHFKIRRRCRFRVCGAVRGCGRSGRNRKPGRRGQRAGSRRTGRFILDVDYGNIRHGSELWGGDPGAGLPRKGQGRKLLWGSSLLYDKGTGEQASRRCLCADHYICCRRVYRDAPEQFHHIRRHRGCQCVSLDSRYYRYGYNSCDCAGRGKKNYGCGVPDRSLYGGRLYFDHNYHHYHPSRRSAGHVWDHLPVGLYAGSCSGRGRRLYNQGGGKKRRGERPVFQ